MVPVVAPPAVGPVPVVVVGLRQFANQQGGAEGEGPGHERARGKAGAACRGRRVRDGVDGARVVGRGIEGAGPGRRDEDAVGAARHDLRPAADQVARGIGPRPLALHGRQHIAILVDDRAAELRRPGHVRRHPPDDRGKVGQEGEHARVPVAFGEFVLKLGAGEIRGILEDPARRAYLVGIGGGRQHLLQQRVGVERNGRDQRVERRRIAIAVAADALLAADRCPQAFGGAGIEHGLGPDGGSDPAAEQGGKGQGGDESAQLWTGPSCPRVSSPGLVAGH